MSSGFPLLRTPHVVLAQIINSKDLPELLLFSLCSKRCNFLVKYLINKKPYHLSIQNHHINLHKPANPCQTYYQFKVSENVVENGVSVEILGHKTAISTVNETTLVCFEDSKLGSRVITDYFCDLFNLNVYCLSIGKNQLWMVDWINNRQTVPIVNGVFMTKGIRLTEDEYLSLLQNLTPSHAKSLCTATSRDFVFSGTLPKIDLFRIFHARWLKVDHLITMDIMEVLVVDSKISSSDFNRFMINWLAGGNNRMKIVHLRTKNGFDVNEVLDGLMDQVTVVTEERKYQGQTCRCEFKDVHDVRRSDGVTASIWLRETQIWFLVWPDVNGKFGDSVW